MKDWKTMNEKERNDFLGNSGGCGVCVFWNKKIDHFGTGLEVGCMFQVTNPNAEPHELYDNGCVHHATNKG